MNRLLLLTLSLFMTVFQLEARYSTEERRYVKENGTGNGLSWTTASGNLQEMINQEGVTEIWVAAGTYKPFGIPGTGTSPKDRAFSLRKNVKIYGGFYGTENLFIERWSQGVSILSGDFDQTDIVSYENGDVSISGNETNVHHVVIAAGDVDGALLDRFTITGGNATSSESPSVNVNGYSISTHNGGGIYITNATPTLKDLILTENSAQQGGGIYIENGAPVLENLHIHRNTSTNGGGIYLHTASPIITHSSIEKNNATNDGGGISSTNSSVPEISETTVEENKAGRQGGGLNFTTDDLVSPALTKVSVISNRANSAGGGIFSFANSLHLTNVEIRGNTAANYSGGIHLAGGVQPRNLAAPILDNVLISGNMSEDVGGAMSVVTASPVITNSVICGNRATDGGAFFLEIVSSLTTFSFNIRNSIVTNNSSALYNQTPQSGSITYQYSLVQDGGATVTEENGNIPHQISPLFIVSPSFVEAPFTDGNYRLSPCSHLVNKGNNAFAQTIATDLDGTERIYNNITVDIGAYETEGTGMPAPPQAVAQTVPSSGVVADLVAAGTNLKWYNAESGGNPLASETPLTSGLYYVSQTSSGCESYRTPVAVTVNSTPLPPSAPSPQTFLPGSTIADLSAEGNDLKWYFNSSGGEPLNPGSPLSNHTFHATQTVDGMESPRAAVEVILLDKTKYVKQEGTGDGSSWENASNDLQAMIDEPGVRQVWVAGGTYTPIRKAIEQSFDAHRMFVMRKNVLIYGSFSGEENHLDERNLELGEHRSVLKAADDAYHVMLSAGQLDAATLDGFTITGGKATSENHGTINVNGQTVSDIGGGGLYIVRASPSTSFKNLTITENSALGGGGVYIEESEAQISHCAIVNNSAQIGAGIMTGPNSHLPVFSDLVIYGNSADYGGGAIAGNSPYILVNATIVGNSVPFGGGIIFNQTTTATAYNTILWGNTVHPESQTYSIGVSYFFSLAQGAAGNPVTGNLDGQLDPMFQDLSKPAGDDGVWGTWDDGLRLQHCSPVTNSGTNVALIPGSGATLSSTDITGSGRSYLGPDMGAYETYTQAGAASVPSANYTITARHIGYGTYSLATKCQEIIASVETLASPPTGNATLNARLWVDENQPNSYVRRHVELNQETGDENIERTVTLYFSQEDFDAFNTADNLLKLPAGPEETDKYAHILVEKVSGTTQDGTGSPASYTGLSQTLTPTLINWNSFAGRWEISFKTTGFSGFFIKTQESPLPLNLVRFGGIHRESVNVLTWETVYESEVDHFEIQRSQDAVAFSPTGIIAAQNQSAGHYQFQDLSPFPGYTYYRLRMVDSDGSFGFSPIISVGSPPRTKYVLSPNPATERVHISRSGTSPEEQPVTITDITGKTIKTILLAGNDTFLDLRHFDSGLYLVRFPDGQVIRLTKP